MYFDEFRFMGAALVIIGLYGVLWGKDKEMNEKEEPEEKPEKLKPKHRVKSDTNEDIESRLPGGGGAAASSSNGSTRPISP